MTARWVPRVRAIVALALFALASGAAQVADGLIYHRRPAPIPVTRVNTTDRTHAASCNLDQQLATPPPVSSPDDVGRLEPPIREAVPQPPVETPRTRVRPGSISSRAPPALA